jgi:hypothetical protein
LFFIKENGLEPIETEAFCKIIEIDLLVEFFT